MDLRCKYWPRLGLFFFIFIFLDTSTLKYFCIILLCYKYLKIWLIDMIFWSNLLSWPTANWSGLWRWCLVTSGGPKRPGLAIIKLFINLESIVEQQCGRHRNVINLLHNLRVYVSSLTSPTLMSFKYLRIWH